MSLAEFQNHKGVGKMGFVVLYIVLTVGLMFLVGSQMYGIKRKNGYMTTRVNFNHRFLATLAVVFTLILVAILLLYQNQILSWLDNHVGEQRSLVGMLLSMAILALFGWALLFWTGMLSSEIFLWRLRVKCALMNALEGKKPNRKKGKN